MPRRTTFTARTRTAALASAAALLLIPLGAGSASSAAPSTELAIDFSADGYTLADQSPAGQNGWNGWGHPATRYDWALADAAGFPDSSVSGLVMRFSNAIDNTGQYGNVKQLSSPVIEAAGEDSTGATFDTFEASFTVASATGGLQPGLNVEVSIDGRDSETSAGTRAGGLIGLRHTDDGLQIFSRWPVPGSPASTDDWRNASVVVPADEPHQITARAQFIEGGDDILEVFVDGDLRLTGSTFEGWHDAVAAFDSGDPLDTDKRIANALLFRTNTSGPTSDGMRYATGLVPTSTQIAALDGNGFLYSDISYRVFNTIPSDPPADLPAEPEPAPDATLPAFEKHHEQELSYELTGFNPYENVYATWYSTPVFGGWFQADASGALQVTLTVPGSLPAGLHTIQFVGQDSGRTVTGQVTVVALAATGAESAVPLLVAAGALLAGGFAFVAVARVAVGRRRRAQHLG